MGEREAFITQTGCCITRVGCRITPAHPAPSLKRQPPSELRLSWGQISVAFNCQDLLVSSFTFHPPSTLTHLNVYMIYGFQSSMTYDLRCSPYGTFPKGRSFGRFSSLCMVVSNMSWCQYYRIPRATDRSFRQVALLHRRWDHNSFPIAWGFKIFTLSSQEDHALGFNAF